jgi:hypothetical protein
MQKEVDATAVYRRNKLAAEEEYRSKKLELLRELLREGKENSDPNVS